MAVTTKEVIDISKKHLRELPKDFFKRANQISVLKLNCNDLTRLPREIGQFSNLKKLFASYNELYELPPEIGQLRNLSKLFLFHNHLSALPSEIGQLTKLTVLFIYNNSLTTLPPEIGKLSNLTTLLGYNNRLTALPRDIGKLSKLEALNLFQNRLTALPREIGQLSRLTFLNVSYNLLSSLPAQVGQLSNLTALMASDNKLEQIPNELGNLSHLTSLRLDNNLLSNLPSEIGQLTQLVELYTGGNNFSTPSADFGHSYFSGIDKITEYSALYRGVKGTPHYMRSSQQANNFGDEIRTPREGTTISTQDSVKVDTKPNTPTESTAIQKCEKNEHETHESEAKAHTDTGLLELVEREVIEALEEKAIQESKAMLRKEETEHDEKREAYEKAKLEREKIVQLVREARIKAEREAYEKIEREAKEKAEREAKEKVDREAKEKGEREAKEKAKREAAEKAEREAKEKAKREAAEKVEREAKEKAKSLAKEKAELEAKLKAYQEAQAKAEREVKDIAKLTAALAEKEKAKKVEKEKVKPEANSTPAKYAYLKGEGTGTLITTESAYEQQSINFSGTPPAQEEIHGKDAVGIARLLHSLGFNDTISDKFITHEISGDIFLTLTDQQLKEDIGIKALGSRLRIIKFINQIKDSEAGAVPVQQLFIFYSLVQTKKSKFSVPDSEPLEYQGEVNIPQAPTRSCVDELLANASVLSNSVPLLYGIVQNAIQIFDRTIMKREKAVKLIKEYGLTKAEVMSLIIYSYDTAPIGGVPSENVYFQLNEALRNRGKREFVYWRGFLWYMNSAMKKLPDFEGRVFRGCNTLRHVAKYKLGREITWSGLTSCSIEQSVAQDFAGSGGLLFIVDIHKGKYIRAFSAVHKEKEVILSPNATLIVADVNIATTPNTLSTIRLIEKSGAYKF